MAAENIRSEEAGEEVLEISLHRIFLGNPGTGKTTVAKLYGKLLAEMGYLSNGEVVVVGASQLTGAFVGSTATKTNELLDSVAGKVLVIDEAYILASSQYGKEALDVLVERVQGTPGEDFAVILCGYNDPMRKMLSDCNPGLARRFKIEDAFLFEDYSDEQLVEILQKMAKESGMLVSTEIAQSVVKKVISKQRSRPNFGNAGAVANLLDRGKQKLMGRTDKKKEAGQWVLVEDDFGGVEYVAREPLLEAISKEDPKPQAYVGLPVCDASFAQQDHPNERFASDVQQLRAVTFQDKVRDSRLENIENAVLGPNMEELQMDLQDLSVTFGDTLANANAEQRKEVEKEAAAEWIEVVLDVAQDDSNMKVEEKEVSFVETTVTAPQPVDTSSQPPLDDDRPNLWAALEEACVELQYTLLELVAFLRTAAYPSELLMLIMEKVRCQDLTYIREMLEPQRVEMCVRVEEALRVLEIERLRKIEEERKARDERAKEALRLAQEKEKRKQEKLRRLGKCPMQFDWISQGNGGYRCAGGSHFVSESELNWEEN